MASRNIADCVPELQVAWTDSQAEWKQLFPDQPQPFLTCTHRSDEEQEILYMMNKNGKDDDGDGKIDEGDEWRSNAKPGQSKHNKFPAEALDIAFKNSKGKLDWSEKLFAGFAILMKKRGIKWGGDWVSLKKSKKNDTPHFEV